MSESVLLEEAFSNEAPPSEAPPEAPDETPAEAAPEEAAEVADEPSEETVTPEVTPEAPPAGFVPKQALAEERRKRKELNERLLRLEGRLDEQGRAVAPVAEPEQSEDERKAELEYFYANPIDSMKRLKDEAKAEALQSFRTEELNARIARSEARAKKAHDDSEEVLAEFVRLSNDDPSFSAGLHLQEDPAEWAYQRVKTRERLADIENIDEWKAAETKRIREEIEKEAKTKAASDAADSVTPTNADARSVGGTTPVSPHEEDALLREVFPD